MLPRGAGRLPAPGDRPRRCGPDGVRGRGRPRPRPGACHALARRRGDRERGGDRVEHLQASALNGHRVGLRVRALALRAHCTHRLPRCRAELRTADGRRDPGDPRGGRQAHLRFVAPLRRRRLRGASRRWVRPPAPPRRARWYRTDPCRGPAMTNPYDQAPAADDSPYRDPAMLPLANEAELERPAAITWPKKVVSAGYIAYG